MGVKDYREFVAWQRSRELADRINVLTSAPALQREFVVVRQLRASANSVCANIAEGFGRFSPKEFARFLRIARGSAMEVQEHLHELRSRQLIAESDAAELATLCRRALGTITPLIRYLDKAKPP